MALVSQTSRCLGAGEAVEFERKQALETAIMLPITLLAPGSGTAVHPSALPNSTISSLAAEKMNRVTIFMCWQILFLQPSLSKNLLALAMRCMSRLPNFILNC